MKLTGLLRTSDVVQDRNNVNNYNENDDADDIYNDDYDDNDDEYHPPGPFNNDMPSQLCSWLTNSVLLQDSLQHGHWSLS